MRRWVKRLAPDVLEAHSPYVAAAAALGLGAYARVRTFVWHADFIDTYLRGGLERRVGARATDVGLEPLWAWVRTITAGSDATFAASRFQVDKLRSHGAVRVEYLPFGVETEIFHPGRRDLALRDELLAGKSGPLFVAIGRFAVEKRWDVVLDAYDRIVERARSARLILLGDGPERPQIEARYRGRDDVTIVGFERDRVKLARTLASADVLLHACPYETFGLGVAEAIASGLPAVVPDQGGAAEQAVGASVVTVPAGNAEATAEAALALLRRTPEELRSHAVATAQKILSIEAHFRALFDRYQTLLADAPSRRRSA